MLKRVRSGDRLNIPAATFNTFVDAAQDFLRRRRSIGRTPTADEWGLVTFKQIKVTQGKHRLVIAKR